MRTFLNVGLLTVWAVLALLARLAQAEQILTAEGESLSSMGVTISARQLTIPPLESSPARQVGIEDLVYYNQTIQREMGDLKTRFLRIEHLSPTPTNLSLAEVMVFEGNQNVANQGRATQDGIDQNGNPERAIDGNTNGDYATAQSTTHSALSIHPWWELDLQRDVPVRQIEIWNRTDGGLGKRLAGALVVLLDANRKPLWVHHLDKAGQRTLLKIPPKGSQLGRGDLKQFERYAGVSATVPDAMTDQESRLELTGGGQISGKLGTWTAEALSIEARFGDKTLTLAIPPAMIRALWSYEVASDKLKIDRSGEPRDADSVYAKSDSGEVKRVSGKIVGLAEQSLAFELDGQVRQLAWAKVAGLTFRQPEVAPDGSEFELVDFVGGQRLSGHCTSLTMDLFQMETLWKQPIELPRAKLSRFSVKNGRMQSLVERTPSHVEQVGYLDLVRPYQVNKSFSGSTLQIKDLTYPEGLCMHSHSLLDYDLGEGFQRFRSEVGLQKEDGDEGHVMVRVRVDGVVKFEEAFAGGQPAKDVIVDLTGGQTLQLEVDFGEGFDVADHLVWGNPILLKAAKK